MAIPNGITREHVLQAMTRLRAEGIPAGAESTKYDVLHPDGVRLPPKVVIELAARIATGQDVRRKDFSGGEETNAPLSALGFEVVLKPGLSRSDLSIDDVAPGATLTNAHLTEVFRVGNSGGMRWSSHTQCLVLIADHTKGLYDDRWVEGTRYYTGMGKVGDQPLKGQNLRLARQRETNLRVHLFEVFEKDRYVHAGRVVLSDSVREEVQPDENGRPRKVVVFPLELADAPAPPVPEIGQIDQIRAKRQRQFSAKSIDEVRKLAAAGGKEKPGRRQALAAVYDRDEAVVAFVKLAADGICDLCGEPAPFEARDGTPYLECHHVHHLAKGGADVIANAVALCPNCHRKMYVIDRQADRSKLIRLRDEQSTRERQNEADAGIAPQEEAVLPNR